MALIELTNEFGGSVFVNESEIEFVKNMEKAPPAAKSKLADGVRSIVCFKSGREQPVMETNAAIRKAFNGAATLTDAE